MAKKERYIVGLDIGSAKTCALMGELDEDGIKFVAIGATESKGLRKGLIVNLDAANQSKLRVSAKLLALARVIGHSQAER